MTRAASVRVPEYSCWRHSTQATYTTIRWNMLYHQDHSLMGDSQSCMREDRRLNGGAVILGTKLNHLTWRTSVEQLSSLYGAKPSAW